MVFVSKVKNVIKDKRDKIKAPKKIRDKKTKKEFFVNDEINKIDEKIKETSPLTSLQEKISETIDESIKQHLKEDKLDENKALETIENLDFFSGKNKLSIRFSKRHNRMYRIQVFLNDTIQIMPVTYNGVSTGLAFWNLLKGALK
jgi:vacuolar-type H+-ATPase subunit I/STV1